MQQLQHTLVALDGFPVLKTRHLKIRHPSIVFCALCCRTSQVGLQIWLQWPSPQDLRTNEPAAAQALLADETKDSDPQRDLAALPGQPRWALSRRDIQHDQITRCHGLQNDAKRC
jgi:hypothetical protein